MATRIAFSTHWPERMGDLAGKPTYFPEKVMCGIYPDFQKMIKGLGWMVDEQIYTPDLESTFLPKTTTIRSNYNYWKSKEGQMIQPFIWAGKPYRSKQVVFCPEVRLKRVQRANIYPEEKIIELPDAHFLVHNLLIEEITIDEGFDSVEDFFMWFNEDFEGALLEFGMSRI